MFRSMMLTGSAQSASNRPRSLASVTPRLDEVEYTSFRTCCWIIMYCYASQRVASYTDTIIL